MRKLLKNVPAAALLACACAPSAWAQEPEASKPAEVVRERRVEAAESRAGAEKPADKSAEKPKAPPAEPAASDAEVEALRAQAEAAAGPAERGRLRLSLAELL